MANKPKSYIVFLDVDKTILSINSGAVLVKLAFKDKLLTKHELIKAYYYSVLYKLNIRKPEVIIASLGSWLKGISTSDIKLLCKRIVDEYLIDSIRPNIRKELETHRQNGAELVILSSAINEMCQPLGQYLGIDHQICTNMEIKDDILTGSPIGKYCFDEEKKVRLLHYCTENNYKLNQAYYYGDSISDLPALEAVGNPVCICPDKRLRKIAIRKGWQIYYW